MTRSKKGSCLSTTRGIMPLGLFLLVTTLILGGCGQLFFRRNPELSLLAPDLSGEAANPAWTPDGMTLYFTAAHGGGQLRATHSDGTAERLVLDGKYGSCCVSPDGATLALVAATSGNSRIGGALLQLDTLGHILDTLSLTDENVSCVRFGNSSDTLYYLANDSVFRLELGSGLRDLVLTRHFGYEQDFDVWRDTLLALPGIVYHILSGRVDSVTPMRQPRFSPTDPNVLLGVLGSDQFKHDMALVDRSSGSVTHLDASPHYSCDIMDPCWSPDGKSIVMSAAEVVMDGGWPDNAQMAGRYDLWELIR